jgi:hypothetical protein
MRRDRNGQGDSFVYFVHEVYIIDNGNVSSAERASIHRGPEKLCLSRAALGFSAIRGR